MGYKLKKERMNKQINHKKQWLKYCMFGLSSILISVSSQAAVSDLQINALISQAIDSHPLVNSARAEQQATTEGISAAKLNLLPTPSISSGYNSTSKEVVTTAALRQTLWSGGKLTANVNQAIFDDKAAVETIFEEQNKVAKNTIDAWQSYITAVSKQRVYQNNLKVLDGFLQMMQRRVAQGVSARIELDLINNRILQEQNKNQAAEEQQRIAVARLEQIIGEKISYGSAIGIPQLTSMVQDVKSQSVKFEQMAFSDASNEVSFYNPSVVKAAFQIESAKHALKAERAAMYPEIYAQYAYEYYHDSGKDDDQLSLGLNYAPGSGFSNVALARASQARVNSLQQSQEATRRTVLEEIQTKYQQFVSTRDRERSLIAAVAGSQIVVDSYRRQFVAGRKSWLEVLNAIRELGDYQDSLVSTQAEMLGSFYSLQVDFGLMPWQQFYQNRLPIRLFHPVNKAREWIEGDVRQ